MAPSSLLTSSVPSGAGAVDVLITREMLGEHILAEIVRCSGPQLPCFSTDQIIDGFWDRFGPDAMVICHQAFVVHNGTWRGAPVTILRFQAHHDGFFAIPLLEEAKSGG